MNLFTLPPGAPGTEEFKEILCSGAGIEIERIVSHGQRTPEGEWLDQDRDEWVVLLQGEAKLRYTDGSKTDLQAGDWVFLPGHMRHRVEATSRTPPCIWLAIHGTIRILPQTS